MAITNTYSSRLDKLYLRQTLEGQEAESTETPRNYVTKMPPLCAVHLALLFLCLHTDKI